LEGLTDTEIASETSTSANAVRLSWRSIYDRIEQGTGLVLPSSDRLMARGPEKRRHALAFVRDHPEEIRPFSWVAIRK
jgi:DNA-binding NarL/FixJ family response regulator